MTINVNKILLLVISIVIPSPFYLKIGGNPIFYVQGGLFLVLFLFFLFTTKRLSLVYFDKLLLVYVSWNVMSFFVNVPFTVLFNDSDLVSNQLTSLIMSIALMTPYCIGRNFDFDENLTVSFISVLQYSYFFAVTYFLVMYVRLLPDLFLARELIGQRIPLMIALFSTILFFYWCLIENKKNTYLIISFIGCTLVFISLTRAAYIQIIVSFFFFIIHIVKYKKVKITTLLYSFVFLFVFILLCYGFFVNKTGVDPSILFDRLQQILEPSKVTASDESASVRITIWLHLFDKLLKHPIGLFFGFGQLGPSYIGESFVSLYGEFISEYSAHNQYLDTVVRSGIFGLFIELYVFIKVITCSIQESSSAKNSFFCACGFSLIGVMFYSLFHETLRYHMFTCFFWFYVGLLANSSRCKY